MVLISTNPMNTYLRIEEYNDSCTAADYILHDSAVAIIHFLKKIGFIEFSDIKINLPKKKNKK